MNLPKMRHSGKKGGGRAEPLKEHLQLVSQRAAQYASFFGAKEEAEIAGLLHDLGKYSDLFLRRLENKESGLDHWSAGAYATLAHYQMKAFAGALAIQGHHIGLQHGCLIPEALKREFSLMALNQNHPLSLRLTEKDHKLLLQRFQGDSLILPPIPPQSIYDPQSLSVAGMIDVRMLFSALVDADYIETEAHFQGDIDGTKRYRQDGIPLEVNKAIGFLFEYLDKIRRESKADEKVNSLREDLLKACLEAAELPPGVFTLTAPTGAGKTLAMLAFALKHAQKYRATLRRIVIVIPYLTIIEQTARIYQNIFQAHFWQLHKILIKNDLQKKLAEFRTICAFAPYVPTLRGRWPKGEP